MEKLKTAPNKNDAEAIRRATQKEVARIFKNDLILSLRFQKESGRLDGTLIRETFKVLRIL